MCLGLSGSFENTRMCLLKIQEPLQKQIIMKLIYYKGKTKIGFYPKNLDPTCKYHCKTTFSQKHRIDESSVRSFCIGWFGDILEEEAGFNKKPKRLVLPKIKDFQVLDQKVDRIPKWNDQKWCQTSYLSNGTTQTNFFIKKNMEIKGMGQKSMNL